MDQQMFTSKDHFSKLIKPIVSVKIQLEMKFLEIDLVKPNKNKYISNSYITYELPPRVNLTFDETYNYFFHLYLYKNNYDNENNMN